MKKFAIAAATATALTLTMANAAFAQTTQTTQSPMTLAAGEMDNCLLYTSPSPRDLSTSRMPSSA